jgi:hypothetical protein
MNTRKMLIGAAPVIIGLPVGPDSCSVCLRSESDQRHNRLFGPQAGVPAICPAELRPCQAHAARHQHARRSAVAGRPNGNESGQQGGR